MNSMDTKTIGAYALMLLIVLPWIGMAFVSVFGGQVSYESEGLIPQVKRLYLHWLNSK